MSENICAYLGNKLANQRNGYNGWGSMGFSYHHQHDNYSILVVSLHSHGSDRNARYNAFYRRTHYNDNECDVYACFIPMQEDGVPDPYIYTPAGYCIFFIELSTHRSTESNTLQGYVTSVMNSERGYIELSLLYMERRFNIYLIS